MDTFNGYAEDEARTITHRPTKADKGHTIVKRTTTRLGSSYRFHYRSTCECGASFGSKVGSTSVFYRYLGHLRHEGVA